MNYEHKKVLVVGMARSGVAAAQLLRACGADVTVNDSKSEEELGSQLTPLEGLQLERKFSCPATDLLEGKECLVISPGIPDTAPFVLRAKEMGIYVIGELELAAQLSRGTLLSVSGTNGKTTTVSLLGEIFANSGKVTHVVGNIGYPFSLAALVSRPEDVIVCEVSSFQMETADTFHPHVALLTNITEDHLNRHGTMEVYTALKMRMFANQTAEDYAVFNADDPGLNGLSKQVKSRVMKFSRKKEVREGAFVRDDTVFLRMDGSERKICRTDEIYIPGPHDLEIALGAVRKIDEHIPDLIAEYLAESRLHVLAAVDADAVSVLIEKADAVEILRLHVEKGCIVFCVRHDHCDRGAVEALGDGRGGKIAAVMKLGGGGFDPFAHLRADLLRPRLIPQDKRDPAGGDPRFFRNVIDGGAHAHFPLHNRL